MSDTYRKVKSKISASVKQIGPIIPFLLLMFACLEIMAIINGYILYSTNTTTYILKYLRREAYLSMLLLLPAMIPSWPGKLYSVFLYLLVATFTGANWVHATLYNAPIMSYLVNVAQETNAAEVWEFTQQFIGANVILHALVPFIAGAPFLVLSLKKRPRSPRKFKGAWLPALIILAIVGSRSLSKGFQEVLQLNYLGDFVVSCKNEYIEKQKFLAEINLERRLPTGIRKETGAGRLIVFVIGESSGRNHYGVYGYARNTTPCLSAREEELLIFSNVISPHSHTVSALQKALTFANHEGDEPGCTVIDMFKGAGYHTIVISNQRQWGIHDSPTSSRIMMQADEVFFLTKTNFDGFYSPIVYDGVVIEPLRRNLATHSSTKDLAIIIHLMGSHAGYSNRYPADRARFNDSPPYAENFSLGKKEIEGINHYDNSVAYTDFLLEQIILMLEEEKRPAAFLYFSDHGEAVYEDGYTTGHTEAAKSRYMFEIPFIIWLSDEFKKAHPGIFKEWKNYTARPWQTDDLIYPLMTLAGISFDDYKANKDILSEGFIPEKRIINGTDYDLLFPE